MQSIAAIIETWARQRRIGAVARVIGADGLGPRSGDDLLVIDENGRTGGSLLAGAVQPEIVAAARRLLTTEQRHVLVAIDVDAGDATAAGLTCGGQVELLVQRLDSIPGVLWDTLAGGRPAALVTALGTGATAVVQPGGAMAGSLGDSASDTLAQEEAEALLTHPGPSTSRLHLGPAELVVEAWNPVPRLVVVGASDVSVALTRQVELLGWTATTAVGAESALAAIEQLSQADVVVVVIDHDPFVAGPALAAALRRGIGYVGALGSRRTQERRRQHLADLGVRDVDVERLHGPTGLDLGARSPAETAVSIVAEVIAVRSGRSGEPLARTTSRISG